MDIPKILAAMCPGAQWSLDGDAYSGLVWPEQSQAKPTEDEIRNWNDAKSLAAINYRELRAAAYPPITDYLDAVVKGDESQVQAYKDACLAVKEKYPKL